MAAALAGVTFRKGGKLHYYAIPESLTLQTGDFVIAETETGPEWGEVRLTREVSGTADELPSPYRIVRLASADDQAARARGDAIADRAREVLQACADSLRLPMRIIDAEVSFAGDRVTGYFVADDRIDFRQLVKDSAGQLRMRIHLYQVGTRDHAKALGGYGPCGRPLCCTTFLRDFAPVTMRMAKDQSLYLNPSKFSGVCGKLMCCLRYEHDTYVEAKEKLPAVGTAVACPNGIRGIVAEVDLLNERLTVRIHSDDGDRFATFRAAEVAVARACGDCGSAGGGCASGNCASGSCGTTAATAPIQIADWRRGH